MVSYAQAFGRSLTTSDHSLLRALRAGARQTPPADFLTWYCNSHAIGTMQERHAQWLAARLGNCNYQAQGLVWHAGQVDTERRSHQLQAALVQLRDLGHVAGWRGEPFSFWLPANTLTPDKLPEPGEPAFLRIERAGFHFLGLMSHAVHVNGFTPEGHMWCGQRSAHKATDPGFWDNFTAGGLAAGERLLECAARELWEEAGYRLQTPEHLVPAGRIRIACNTPTGWHDEMLHVYQLSLPTNFVPNNQDGEVQGFDCLSGPQVMARLRAQQFTRDAALAIAQSLHHCEPHD
jgi:8-oxo-dGTP pyrophosphatase MutT (NUDIX family)